MSNESDNEETKLKDSERTDHSVFGNKHTTITEKRCFRSNLFKNRFLETDPIPRADHVPVQASFFSGLEKEVKKIIRACQPKREQGVEPKREDIPDSQNVVNELQGHTSNWKQRAKKIGTRNAGMVQTDSIFTGLEKEMNRILKACKPAKALKKKLKAKCSKFNRNKTDFATKRPGLRKIKKERARDGGAGSQVGSCGLTNRNWQRISIHPFINFLRVFRKKVPTDCPLTIMKLKGREIWRKMDKERKYSFVEQAIRAKQKGYIL